MAIRSDSSTPSELARQVALYLQAKKLPVAFKALTAIVESAYAASLHTEEARPIHFTLAFVNPARPDPNKPPRIRPQRATPYKFATALPLTPRNIAKLAPALHPWSSMMAVYARGSLAPTIWGFTDQEMQYQSAVHHEGGARFDRPGHFQLEVSGPGILEVYDDDVFIAGIKRGESVAVPHDAIRAGPVHDKLARMFEAGKSSVRESQKRSDYFLCDITYKSLWVGSLCRILLRMRKQGHGGALLLDPNPAQDLLRVKYACDYNKLHGCLINHARNLVELEVSINELHSGIGDRYQDFIPSSLYWNLSGSEDEASDDDAAERGCVGLIASMAAVDGLVLMTGGLVVRGFGVEILAKADPPLAFTAGRSAPRATKDRLLELSHFGTRHRSMFRYCHARPQAVGFVVSNDGDIRAITKLGSKVLMWDGIKLYGDEGLFKRT